MKITYRIEQYDVDNFLVVITSPEFLAGLHTRIYTPHFLLSDLQQNIKTNLNQTIRRICIKNEQYANILQNESFEFEPDEQDKHNLHDVSCWFYTGKFINDTKQDFSDKEAISYKNLIRYDQAYSATSDGCCRFITDPKWQRNKKEPIKIKSLEPNKAIDVARVASALGISHNEVYKFAQKQRNFRKNKGNSYGNQIVFPRHIEKNGHIYFPIAELQKYIDSLYKLKSKYPHIRKKYDDIKENLIKYSKRHMPQNTGVL